MERVYSNTVWHWYFWISAAFSNSTILYLYFVATINGKKFARNIPQLVVLAFSLPLRTRRVRIVKWDSIGQGETKCGCNGRQVSSSWRSDTTKWSRTLSLGDMFRFTKCQSFTYRIIDIDNGFDPFFNGMGSDSSWDGLLHHLIYVVFGSPTHGFLGDLSGTSDSFPFLKQCITLLLSTWGQHRSSHVSPLWLFRCWTTTP